MSNFNHFEKKIAYLLSSFPFAKLLLKKFYQRLNFTLHRKRYRFKINYALHKIALADASSFFGYYDKSPINSTDDYIIFQSTAAPTNILPNPKQPIDLVLYDLAADKFLIIDQIYSYNWQQGCKLMWLTSDEFIYNNYSDDKKSYCSIIYNTKTRDRRVIPEPIYDCYKNKYALSLNFERLNVARGDYSYGNATSTVDWSNNELDGIRYINLDTGESSLLISLQEVIDQNYKSTMSISKHKFNHIMISPSGDKFMFMHRWFTPNNKRFDSLWVYNFISGGLLKLADEDMVSHCCWDGDDSIVAYLKDSSFGNQFYKIDVASGEKKLLSLSLKNIGDGHPTIYDGLMLFDSYPDKSRMKRLYVFNMKNERLFELGEFFESFSFYNETRCDLHPRFNCLGNRVYFDSVHNGKRHLYSFDFDKGDFQ